jgi:hypothetical protein
MNRSSEKQFAGCPFCEFNDGYINDGPDHWFICKTHQTKWRVGSNMFSGWREETDEERLRSRYRLLNYRSVEPRRPG